MTRKEIEKFIDDDITFITGLNLVNRRFVVLLKNKSSSLKVKFSVYESLKNQNVSLEFDQDNQLTKYTCSCANFNQQRKKCIHLAAALLKYFPEPNEIKLKINQFSDLDLTSFKSESWKKVKFVFEKIKDETFSKKHYSLFSVEALIDGRKKLPILATSQLFNDFPNQLNLIELNGTGHKVESNSFNQMDLQIFQYLISNQPQQLIEKTDLNIPGNSFWISDNLIDKLLAKLKEELNFKDNYIELVNKKASAFYFVSKNSKKRIVLKNFKSDNYYCQIQVFLDAEWINVFASWTNKNKKIFFLEDAESLAWKGKYNETVSLSNCSIIDYYTFYYLRQITDFWIITKDNIFKKLFEYLPRTFYELSYSSKNKLFERKIKFLYFNEGLPFSVLSCDTETNLKDRLAIYEKTIVNCADIKTKATKKSINKDASVKITASLIEEIVGFFKSFPKTDLIQCKIDKNLTNEGFLHFNYSNLKKITIQKGQKGKLIIRCDRVNFSISELSAICKEYNGQNDLIITKDCYYQLKSPENILFCEFWSKFDFYDAKSDGLGTFEFPKFRAFDLLSAFGDDVELLKKYADDSVMELIESFHQKHHKSVRDKLIDKPFDKLLRDYQKEGHLWMRKLQNYSFGGILADDMGLGKTVQTISLVAHAYYAIPNDIPSLIIVPTSLLLNWESEFKKFVPELKITTIRGIPTDRLQLIANNKTGVEITSYSYFRRDLEEHQKKIYKFVIIDEAQNIKNHESNLSKAVKMIHASHRFALTGTPIENRLTELWSIFEFITPGLFGTYRDFVRDYERPIIKNENQYITDRLKKKMNFFILRRVKEKVLKELPPKTETDITVELTPEHRAIYENHLNQTQEKLNKLIQTNKGNDVRFQILKLIIELRQICCSPLIKGFSFEGKNAKFNACLELIEEAVANHKKVLVFTQFLGMIDLFETELKRRKITFFTLTGSTQKDKRMASVNQFNSDDTPVFIASLKAGGIGLNLTGAEVVIHYDLWWNIAVQNQATDRVHRIGQKKPVQVYRIIVDDSIEQRIIQIQDSKKHLSKSVISDDKNLLDSLSINELVNLFNPNQEVAKKYFEKKVSDET